MKPADYVHGHADSVVRAHATRTVHDSAAYLLPHLRPGLDLLDVGCGPGSITVGLAAAVAPGRVVAVDTAPEVVPVASAAAARAGVDVEVRTGDVMELPFDDDSFDVVHAHQVLQHVADPVAALGQLRRVTRPGGVVAVRDADYAAMSWYPGGEGLERWRQVYRATARAAGGEPDAGRRLLTWTLDAGFDATSVTADAGVWSYATAVRRRWLAEQWAARSTSSAFATLAVERGIATTEELDAIARAWLAWAAEPGGWFTMVHGQVLARVEDDHAR